MSIKACLPPPLPHLCSNVDPVADLPLYYGALLLVLRAPLAVLQRRADAEVGPGAV